MADSPVHTRFAPSPTGSLHVGGVRTAIYCLLYARHTGGRFTLRIEDTDRRRSTEEATEGILADMRWLGLDWDEGPGVDSDRGPFKQSERRDLYAKYAEQLIEQGHAYWAWESPDELNAMRKEAEAAKRNFHYRQRSYSDDEIARFKAEDRAPVLRFKSPGQDVTVMDRVMGPVTVEGSELDDFVIVKADGWPTYHFAVVIDDHLMEIGLAMRGSEHLKNTHKHAQLYEALGWDPTATGHLSVIRNPEGNAKMSKRDKAKTARAEARKAMQEGGHTKEDWTWLAVAADHDVELIRSFMAKDHDGVATAEAIAAGLRIDLPMIEVMDFRRGGYLPEALINYLALLGWSPGDDREIMTFGEMVETFTIDRVTKTPARFDPDKLAWMNAQYMQSLPMEQLLLRLSQWLEVAPSEMEALDDAARRALLQMYRARAKTFRDIERIGAFFFVSPTDWVAKQVRKHLDKGEGWSRLEQAKAALSDVGRWEAPSLAKAFDALREATGASRGKYEQPVRLAVTGTGVSPELPDTLAFLGREATLDRIDRLLERRPE